MSNLALIVGLQVIRSYGDGADVIHGCSIYAGNSDAVILFHLDHER